MNRGHRALAFGGRCYLVAGYLVAVCLVAGCSTVTAGHGTPASRTASPSLSSSADGQTPVPSAPPSTTTPAKSPAKSPAQVAQELSARTPGQAHCIVRVAVRNVAVGEEAAAYDQAGHISLWRYAAAWTFVATSTYPYAPATLGPPQVRVRCAVLTGMAVGTYIADGSFSGDGSANAAAYTTGGRGWGAIKAESNANIGPSGQGVTFGGIGLANEFDFVRGLLQTADCSATIPIAGCSGTHRVLKLWQWAGSDFVLRATAGLPR